MKHLYFDDIRNALKSKEYWFGFALVVVSCVLASISNLSPTGVYGKYSIGSAEFFIAAMYNNTLLQISAPIIAIFVCMNRRSLFMSEEGAIQKSWTNRQMRARILANVTVGGSVYLLSFLLIFLSGLIVFPSSTGSTPPHYGLFKELYQSTPVGYILAYIMYNCICGALYALFGVSLKVLIVKPVNIALFVPLVFYSCFIRLGWLFRFLDGIISFISPLYTFDVSSSDIPPLKKVAELSFVFVISITLVVISRYRNTKQVKLANDKDTKLNNSL